MSVTRGFMTFIATSVVALSIGAGSATAAIDPNNPYVPATTAVSDTVKNSFSIFRKTDPVQAPSDLIAIIGQDVQNGNPAFGQNATLARPAFRSATNQQDPFWVVPGAEDHLCLWVPDGKDAKFGWGVACAPVNEIIAGGLLTFISKGSKLFPVKSLAVLVPDTVKSIRVTTRKKLKSGKKKTKRLTVPVYDNVGYSVAQNIVSMTVLRATYKLEPEKKKKKRS